MQMGWKWRKSLSGQPKSIRRLEVNLVPKLVLILPPGGLRNVSMSCSIPVSRLKMTPRSNLFVERLNHLQEFTEIDKVLPAMLAFTKSGMALC
jgi:hypothetical protein